MDAFRLHTDSILKYVFPSELLCPRCESADMIFLTTFASAYSALMGLAEASITRMVVMDHMDWFDPNTVCDVRILHDSGSANRRSNRVLTASSTSRSRRCTES